MSTTTAKIAAGATRNRELIAILTSTDHARSELEMHDRYLSDLSTSIANAEAERSDVEARLEKEQREHESYRNSVFKRLTYKLGGKKEQFEQRACKEEREYFDALSHEQKTKQLIKNMKTAHEKATAAKKELEHLARQNDEAKKELELLYERVFKGPSPGYPLEDEKELARREAEDRYAALKRTLDERNQAVRILERAMAAMRRSLTAMREASSLSRNDVWGGSSGSMADMMERNALSRASVLRTEAKQLVDQARRFDDAVSPLVHAGASSQADILTDVFFDNLLTDRVFQQQVAVAVRATEEDLGFLESQLGEARTRAGRCDGDVKRLQATLEKTRVELQRIREAEFARVGGDR